MDDFEGCRKEWRTVHGRPKWYYGVEDMNSMEAKICAWKRKQKGKTNYEATVSNGGVMLLHMIAIMHGEWNNKFCSIKRMHLEQILKHLSNYITSQRKPEHRLCNIWLRKWGRPVERDVSNKTECGSMSPMEICRDPSMDIEKSREATVEKLNPGQDNKKGRKKQKRKDDGRKKQQQKDQEEEKKRKQQEQRDAYDRKKKGKEEKKKENGKNDEEQNQHRKQQGGEIQQQQPQQKGEKDDKNKGQPQQPPTQQQQLNEKDDKSKQQGGEI